MPPTLNSVTSVTSLAIGPSASKSRASRFGEDLPTWPMQERYLLRLRVRHSSPSPRMALSTVLSAMRMPVDLHNVSATLRYPYLSWGLSHISAMAGRSAACLSEGGLTSW